MSRTPLSLERIHYHAEEQTVTVDAGKSQAGSRNWPVPELFALLAAHIPCRYESLITYYGVYSSSHRGKLKRENRGRTDRGDPGGGCAGDFRYAAAFKLGEIDSENLRNGSPDLQRVRGANADHSLHHRSA